MRAMKKLLALACVLALLIPAAAAADQDIIVQGGAQMYDNLRLVSRNCFVVDAKEHGEWVYVYAELVNMGANRVQVDHDATSFRFYDGAGNLIFETQGWTFAETVVGKDHRDHIFIYDLLQPGHDNTRGAFPGITRAADYSLNLVLRDNSYDKGELDNVQLKASASVEKKESNWFQRTFESKGPHYYDFQVDVTNDSGYAIHSSYGLSALYVLRDENGAPVMIDSWELDIHDLAPGETRHATYSPNSAYLFEFFEKYDFDASSADVYVWAKYYEVQK